MYISATPNIMVDDVAKTVLFYVEKLGFELILSNDENNQMVWAMLGSGTVTLMFQERNSLINEYPTLENHEIKPSLSIFIKVSNIEKLYSELTGKVRFAKKYHVTDYGLKEFAIFDNNENILTIAQN